jgi:hypothetical protein
VFPTLLAAALAAAPPDTAKKADPPVMKDLFAGQPWYEDRPGKAEDFTGVLRYEPRKPGEAGGRRYNPYRLVMEVKGRLEAREVYVAGKTELLKPYVGRKVTLHGKPVEMDVDGKTHREVWPARVTLAETGELDARPPGK